MPTSPPAACSVHEERAWRRRGIGYSNAIPGPAGEPVGTSCTPTPRASHDRAALPRHELALADASSLRDGRPDATSSISRNNCAPASSTVSEPATRFVGELFDSRHDPIAAAMRGHAENPQTWTAAVQEPENVLQALQAGDPIAAQTAIRAHLRASEARWIEGGLKAEPD